MKRGKRKLNPNTYINFMLRTVIFLKPISKFCKTDKCSLGIEYESMGEIKYHDIPWY